MKCQVTDFPQMLIKRSNTSLTNPTAGTGIYGRIIISPNRVSECEMRPRMEMNSPSISNADG